MKWSSFILAISLIISFHELFSQDKLPVLYVIKADTARTTLLPDSCWQMLEEEDEKWTIDRVSRSPIAEKFHSNTGYDRSKNVYWIRYRLKNGLVRDARICLISIASFHDVFTKHADKEWQHEKTGRLIPWSEKDGFKGVNGIPIVIHPGEEVLIYRRIEFDFRIGGPTVLRTGFGFTNNLVGDNYVFSQTAYMDIFGSAILLGLFLLTSILSLFFFQITREREYIIASIGYLFIGLLSYWPYFSYTFAEYPGIVEYTGHFVFDLALFFGVHIIRHFLNVKDRFPTWDKVLIGLSCLPFITHAIGFFFLTSDPLSFTILAIFLPLLFTCLALIKAKDKIAQLVILGCLPVFIYQVIEGLEIVIPVGFEKTWIVIGILSFFWLIISLNRILIYRYNQLQKQLIAEALEKEQIATEREMERRKLMELQKAELEIQVEARTNQLRQSLDELKSTQSQLIQSEKMASLGELTAGIAHEIQNPLNFVNNFSEVNSELISELGEAAAEGNLDEVKSIAANIKENEEKIVTHGKRADAIVKGMLQHSRISSGVKESTDINALADEYLRLAYHGLRAKDKSFNATTKMEFDPSIGNVNIIPQDIGRVILNLITNAFYSVNDKKKAAGHGFEPTVIVSTKRVDSPLGAGARGGVVEISVKDNGNGIPQKALDKIFQPFFTTKPAGQGTGLGLSLSYDIVKVHGGELKVETEEGKGAEFILSLPAKE